MIVGKRGEILVCQGEVRMKLGWISYSVMKDFFELRLVLFKDIWWLLMFNVSSTREPYSEIHGLRPLTMAHSLWAIILKSYTIYAILSLEERCNSCIPCTEWIGKCDIIGSHCRVGSNQRGLSKWSQCESTLIQWGLITRSIPRCIPILSAWWCPRCITWWTWFWSVVNARDSGQIENAIAWRFVLSYRILRSTGTFPKITPVNFRLIYSNLLGILTRFVAHKWHWQAIIPWFDEIFNSLKLYFASNKNTNYVGDMMTHVGDPLSDPSG